LSDILWIKWACFISYPHAWGNLVKDFAKQLKDALENELGSLLNLPVYMDEDRLRPGFDYGQALSTAICESVCMIVIFSPVYEEKTYCLREFLAMERIEAKRRKKLGRRHLEPHRMIIPIVLRGINNLPPKIKIVLS